MITGDSTNCKIAIITIYSYFKAKNGITVLLNYIRYDNCTLVHGITSILPNIDRYIRTLDFVFRAFQMIFGGAQQFLAQLSKQVGGGQVGVFKSLSKRETPQ